MPTEINIARFFTTHYFFTKAGVNFPEIYCNIALDGVFPSLERKINPLPDGLIWLRGMDREPVLTTAAELARWENQRSEEHTSELQSLMRIPYAVLCLKKKNKHEQN